MMTIKSLACGLSLVALAIAAGDSARAQTAAAPYPLEIQTSPAVITIDDHVAASIEFGRNDAGYDFIGFEVLSQFATAVQIDDNQISIDVTVTPPHLGPGEIGLPAFFTPSFQHPLGALRAGAYKIVASVSLADADSTTPIAVGEFTFAVIPEPASLTLTVAAIAAAFAARRR